jgi:hypothetical protein
MDLTDVTITPMIAMGIAVAGPIIKAVTGWGLGVSFLAGVIPGAVAGFFCGLGMFIALS